MTPLDPFNFEKSDYLRVQLTGRSPCGLHRSNFFIPETIHKMIVNHSNRLHVGIDYRRTYELETASLQVLAKNIRFF